MKKLLTSYLVDAVLLILLGIVLVIYPQSTLDFVIHWGGILLLFMGFIKILIYLIQKDNRNKNSLIVSIVQLVCGIIMLLFPNFVKSIIPFVSGIFIAYGAIICLVNAIKLRKMNIPIINQVFILSVITLVLALVIAIYMIAKPAEASGVIIRLIGLGLLMEGVTMLVSLSLFEAKIQS